MDAKFIRNLVISGILLAISVGFITGTFTVVQRSMRLLEVKKEIAALQQQKDQLTQEVRYKTSPEFIEEEARNKLNMVKPGEEVYLKPKIMGDDLLGAQDQKVDPTVPGGFFCPRYSKNNWFS